MCTYICISMYINAYLYMYVCTYTYIYILTEASEQRVAVFLIPVRLLCTPQVLQDVADDFVENVRHCPAPPYWILILIS